MPLNNYHFYSSKNYLYSKPVKGLKVFEQGYRFAFNGKENDNETYGEGNAYDFGARIYDPRKGTYLSVDPDKMMKEGWTPYRFGFDNPIKFLDPDGNFEIDAATAAKYPKLDAALRNIATVYANKPADFKKAYQAYSQLSDKQISEMLTYGIGHGPRIIVEDLGDKDHYGSTQVKDNKDGSWTGLNTIKINDDHAQKLENVLNSNFSTNVEKEAASLIIEVTLLHEGIHTGDVKDGKLQESSTATDIGWEFEELYYGQKISGEGINVENSEEYVKKNNTNNAVGKDKEKLDKGKVEMNKSIQSKLKDNNSKISPAVSTGN